ncbi:MAG: HIT family protein [Gammaproteobacteria bacterium]|nr:HIT family protein [Gammaproteobacteria bacterium]MBU1444600.1 HIT family protein [Gammaproteobacteria bacterium]MBU2286443.1 HIT family protein [Gammaproteobacteria bacterium]MBU2410214.1 HIT family protein [Gammaproteobacteria bacterium]
MTHGRAAVCPLCDGPGGRVIVEGGQWRVVHAAEDGFPGFYRVVWNDHVAEWSDLGAEERASCMDAVTEVERLMRAMLAPTKINLAALGNMVPHLHWHVIARFDWDTRFPAPVWAAPQRERDPSREAAVEAQLPGLERAIVQTLNKRNS